MDHQYLKRRLLNAEKAIRKAIEALDEAFPSRPEPRRAVGECLICKEVIYDDEPAIRECHRKCFDRLYNEEVRTGNETLESLEAKGLIGPKGNPGRKPREKKAAAKTPAVQDILSQAEALRAKRKGPRR